MLHTGSHACLVVSLSLITFHHGDTHLCVKISILTATFSNASPARVTRYVKHWRECPSYTACCRLNRGKTCTLLNKFRIKCSRQTKRNRKHGLETMDHIARNKQRNTQTGFLYCSSLITVQNIRVTLIENRTNHPGTHHSCRIMVKSTDRKLVKLADLLLKGHLPKKFLHSFIIGRLRPYTSCCRQHGDSNRKHSTLHLTKISSLSDES